jgi:NAD(P)-dependent dehydrogenase (short-subunit alcohol dehydrogenase family)
VGRLNEKVAIVTGAAYGIGRGTAAAMAAEGARVLVADVNVEVGAQAAAEIAARGGAALFQPVDVRSAAQVEAMVARAVAEWGGLDIIVNNVGVAISGSAADMTEADWNAVLDVNLSGVWRGMKYAIPQMLRRGGGSIVNVSSLQSLLGFPNWAGYAASKGGINALTRQAAIEYGPGNIRVNAIAPGPVMTQMNAAQMADPAEREQVMAQIKADYPLGRPGYPADVAALAVFLASDESALITGQVFVIDGGRVVRGD